MRLIVAAAVTAFALLLAVPAGAAPRCAGDLYDQEGVQLFETRSGRYEVPTWWACSRRVRTPVRIAVLSPGVHNELHPSGIERGRLVFAIESFADGGGGWDVGWFDVRSGRRAVAAVDTRSRSDFSAPPLGATIDASGAVAYALPRDDDDDNTIGYDVIHRPFADGRFGKEVKIATVKAAELDPDTLAIGDGEVTWRGVGEARSHPIAEEGASGTPPASAAAAKPSCRAGTTLYDFGARIFTASRGLWACARRRVTKLASSRVKPYGYVETDRHLGFALRPGPGLRNGGLAHVALRTGATRVAGLWQKDEKALEVLAVAPESAGTAALLEDHMIVLLPAKGALRPIVHVAEDDIEPHTLRLAAKTVRWRTRGAPGRAALP